MNYIRGQRSDSLARFVRCSQHPVSSFPTAQQQQPKIAPTIEPIETVTVKGVDMANPPALLKLRSSDWFIGITVFVAAFNVCTSSLYAAMPSQIIANMGLRRMALVMALSVSPPWLSLGRCPVANEWPSRPLGCTGPSVFFGAKIWTEGGGW